MGLSRITSREPDTKKELGLNSKTDIERYGIAEFNEACRGSVLRYVKEWRQIVTRLADGSILIMTIKLWNLIIWSRFGGLSNPFGTRDSYMKAIIFSHIVRAVLRYYPTMSFH